MIAELLFQVFAGIPGAPPPMDEARVREWLSSTNDRERSFALYYAGERGFTQFIPQIIEVARDSNQLLPWSLDALIRLRADVPVDVLHTAWKDHRAATLILAARNPSHVRDFVPHVLSDGLKDEEWLAVSNLLVAARSPKVAFSLLQNLRVAWLVTVRDPGSQVMSGGSGMAFMVGCCGLGVPGHLPRPFYRLVQRPATSDVLVAPGRRAIHYRRTLDCNETGEFVDRNEAAAEYLGELLKQDTFQTRRSHGLDWRGPTNFLTELGKLRASTWWEYRKIVDGLIAEKLLTRGEARQLRFEISWSFPDAREVKQSPLPQWPHLERLSYR